MSKVDKDAVKTQLTRARTALLIEYPFFGQLALKLRLVERLDIPTLAVDGKHVFYNPDFVAGLSPNLTKSAMGHEVGHCVFEHIGRLNGRNPKKWNIAGDFVINAMLKDSGMEIGPGWLFNPAFAVMTADQIYNLIPDDPNGDGSGDQPGAGDAGGALDDMLPPEAGTSESQAVEWKIATIQAAATAKAQGKLPAHLERFLDELMAPKVDWRARLRRFVTEISRDDYSWSRPNRRMASYGFILPGLYSENMGEVVVAIDTSGSIDQKTLTAFGSEIKAIVETCRPTKTTVIYCDSHVNHVDEFGPNDVLRFDMHGGGGTDFRPPFEHIDKHGIKPVCFVYLTDGYGPFPDYQPAFPTMWCMTTNVVSPLGETVPIEV